MKTFSEQYTKLLSSAIQSITDNVKESGGKIKIPFNDPAKDLPLTFVTKKAKEPGTTIAVHTISLDKNNNLIFQGLVYLIDENGDEIYADRDKSRYKITSINYSGDLIVIADKINQIVSQTK